MCVLENYAYFNFISGISVCEILQKFAVPPVCVHTCIKFERKITKYIYAYNLLSKLNKINNRLLKKQLAQGE